MFRWIEPIPIKKKPTLPWDDLVFDPQQQSPAKQLKDWIKNIPSDKAVNETVLIRRKTICSPFEIQKTDNDVQMTTENYQILHGYFNYLKWELISPDNSQPIKPDKLDLWIIQAIAKNLSSEFEKFWQFSEKGLSLQNLDYNSIIKQIYLRLIEITTDPNIPLRKAQQNIKEVYELFPKILGD